MKDKFYDVIEQIELVKKKLNYLNTKNKKILKHFFSIIKAFLKSRLSLITLICCMLYKIQF